MPKYSIHLKRIDLVDKKLPFFLIFKKDIFKTNFKVSNSNTIFKFHLGVTDNLPAIYSYTDIQFEANITTDIGIFERIIPLIVDSERVKIETAEWVELRSKKPLKETTLRLNCRLYFL